MECRLYILIGPIGAGKSTFARKMYLRNPDRTIRICLDDIIQMTSFYNYDPELDDFYRDIETSAIVKALLRGMDVIVDRTNLTRRHRERFIRIGKIMKDFAIKLTAVLEQGDFFSKEEEILKKSIGRIVEEIDDDYIKNLLLSSLPEITGEMTVLFPHGAKNPFKLLKKLKIIGVYFKTPYEICLERRLNDPLLSLREITRKINWKKVLDKMIQILELPSLEEGFDELIEIG